MDNLANLKQELITFKNSGMSPQQAIQKLKSENVVAMGAVAAAAVSSSSDAAAFSSADMANAIAGTWTGLTPLALAQLLKIYDDNVEFVATGVMSPGGFPNLSALDLGKVLLDSSMYPNLAKGDMLTVMLSVKFSADAANAAIAQLYIEATYALSITGNNSFLSAPANNAYNFATGDFTVECWVKTQSAGTLISRKSTEGGPGNGGFLLVIKPDGTIKLATDNGYGFYEIDTVPTKIIDRAWHAVSAVRQSGSLAIYVDGMPIQATPRNNINPPINISNNLPLMIGNVAQQQEPFRQFNGQMDEVRIWNRGFTAQEIKNGSMKHRLNGNETGLVGYFTFNDKNGTDSSPLRNNAVPTGNVTYVSPGTDFLYPAQ